MVRSTSCDGKFVTTASQRKPGRGLGDDVGGWWMDCCSSFGIVFVGAKEHSHDSVFLMFFAHVRILGPCQRLG